MAHAPWLRQYPSGFPHSLVPYPDRTLSEILSQTARERPQLPVIVFANYSSRMKMATSRQMGW